MPINSSRPTPVILMVASLTSVILPSGLMVTRGSRLASIRLRAYCDAALICSSDELAGRIADGRHGERDGDRPAVLPDANRLVVLHATAGPDLLEDLVHLRRAFGVDQHRDRLPDDLVGRVPVDQLGGTVPARDDSVERLPDDGVVGGIDDGCEQPRPVVGSSGGTGFESQCRPPGWQGTGAAITRADIRDVTSNTTTPEAVTDTTMGV